MTNENGEWSIKTILPGAYQASATWLRPPHIHYRISCKGYNTLTTQMYFDDPRFSEMNEKDLILSDLPESEQKKLLVKFDDNSTGRFSITLQSIG